MAAANSVDLDALYTYDGLNRLKAYDRGTLDSGHSSLVFTAFAQDWEPDQLNNWSGVDEDSNGNGTNELVQDRTHNDANEEQPRPAEPWRGPRAEGGSTARDLVAITATTGSDWVDPTYDAAGNMITGPTPGPRPARRSTSTTPGTGW